jgi:hypothetical protein
MVPISWPSANAPITKLFECWLMRFAITGKPSARCSSAEDPNASGSLSSASRRKCQNASTSSSRSARISSPIWRQCTLAAACTLSLVCGSFPIHAQTLEPPDAITQKQVLADATENALAHDENLPNFICNQTTRRFEDFNGKNGWRPIDIIVERLTYFEHREDYQVIELNGMPANIPHDQLGGASSSGEFGSILKSIFSPETETEFTWQNWFMMRGRKMHVYSYRVALSKSNYHLKVPERMLDLVASYHGLVFIDAEKHTVHRITLHPDGVPPSFPIQDVSVALDYVYNRIGDTDYLLPLQFELRSREGNLLVKNDVDYDNYRKFEADSNIKFGSASTSGKQN